MRFGSVLRHRSASRITGVAVAAAGLAFIGLGTAGVGTITGGATALAPDCTTSPPTGACLHDTGGFEGVTATTFTGLHDCGFEPGGVAGTTTDGFHFILPDAEGTGFVSLEVWFDVGGSLVTVTTITFTGPGGKAAVIDEPNGATLLEASATIAGGARGTANDGDEPHFVLSSTCPATGVTTTSSSSPTTTGGPTSTTTTTTAMASGGLRFSTTTATTSSADAGGVLGLSTTTPSTPSTGADAQFGGGLALLMLGGGLVFRSTRRSRGQRP